MKLIYIFIFLIIKITNLFSIIDNNIFIPITNYIMIEESDILNYYKDLPKMFLIYKDFNIENNQGIGNPEKILIKYEYDKNKIISNEYKHSTYSKFVIKKFKYKYIYNKNKLSEIDCLINNKINNIYYINYIDNRISKITIEDKEFNRTDILNYNYNDNGLLEYYYVDTIRNGKKEEKYIYKKYYYINNKISKLELFQFNSIINYIWEYKNDNEIIIQCNDLKHNEKIYQKFQDNKIINEIRESNAGEMKFSEYMYIYDDKNRLSKVISLSYDDENERGKKKSVYDELIELVY